MFLSAQEPDLCEGINQLIYQIQLYLPLHENASQYSTEQKWIFDSAHRSRKDGPERQFLQLSAENLLIAFPFCLPLFSLSLSLLHWISCNHRQFSGRLAAGLSASAERVRARWRVKMCARFVCVYMHCLKRSILGKMETVSNGFGLQAEVDRDIFFSYIADYLGWSLDLNCVYCTVGPHTHTHTHFQSKYLQCCCDWESQASSHV